MDKENIKQIVHLELKKSMNRLSDLGYIGEVTEKSIEHLIEVGYDPQFGARPMKRAIQRWVDDALTDTLLDEPTEGSTLVIDYDKEKDETVVSVKEVSEKPKKVKKEKKKE